MCSLNSESIEYLNPCIDINEKDLVNNTPFEIFIKERLKNFQSACYLCEYDKNENIILLYLSLFHLNLLMKKKCW